MRAIHLNRALLVMLGLLLVAAVAVAGDRSEQKSVPEKATYRNEHPPMQFMRGTMNRDGMGRWEIGDSPVWFTAKSKLIDSSNPSDTVGPQEGHVYVLMGHWQGPNFVVRYGADITRAEQQIYMTELGETTNLRSPGPDPSITMGEQPE